jgi:hypothetical protein
VGGSIMAFVSKSHKFIFVHPYKCAGNSVRDYLVKTGDMIEVHLAHSIAKHVKKYFEDKNEINFWNESFKFAFVRNPYSWILSTYFYIKCSKGHERHVEIKGKGFDSFWMIMEHCWLILLVRLKILKKI